MSARRRRFGWKLALGGLILAPAAAAIAWSIWLYAAQRRVEAARARAESSPLTHVPPAAKSSEIGAALLGVSRPSRECLDIMRKIQDAPLVSVDSAVPIDEACIFDSLFQEQDAALADLEAALGREGTVVGTVDQAYEMTIESLSALDWLRHHARLQAARGNVDSALRSVLMTTAMIRSLEARPERIVLFYYEDLLWKHLDFLNEWLRSGPLDPSVLRAIRDSMAPPDADVMVRRMGRCRLDAVIWHVRDVMQGRFDSDDPTPRWFARPVLYGDLAVALDANRRYAEACERGAMDAIAEGEAIHSEVDGLDEEHHPEAHRLMANLFYLPKQLLRLRARMLMAQAAIDIELGEPHDMPIDPFSGSPIEYNEATGVLRSAGGDVWKFAAP